MKVIFFGSSDYVLPIISALSKNFDLILVVTTEKEPSGPVVSHCRSNKIKCISVLSVKDLIRQIRGYNADLGVVADFGIIIPKEVMDAYPRGIINIHPSLLPKYRGPTPVQTAILNGDTKTGITIIKIDEEVDHGPILYQEEAEIKDGQTADELLSELFQKSADFISKTISDYLKDYITLTDQIHSTATFTNNLSRQDGFIDLSGPPHVKKLDRMIRAYHPWPGVWTRYQLGGKELIIKLLPKGQIQVEGKKPVSYKDFLNGYPEAKDFLQKLGLS